jgi:hypothetical protein
MEGGNDGLLQVRIVRQQRPALFVALAVWVYSDSHVARMHSLHGQRERAATVGTEAIAATAATAKPYNPHLNPRKDGYLIAGTTKVRAVRKACQTSQAKRQGTAIAVCRNFSV